MTHIRWMISRDLPSVMDIDTASFEHTWSRDDFISQLRQRNCIAIVAEQGDDITGFMLYELHKHSLQLIRIAVDENHRFLGTGRAMIDKLVNKLSVERRNRIETTVDETNLDAQLFFKQLGFRAYDVLREWNDHTGEDAYQMRYRHIPAPGESSCHEMGFHSAWKPTS